MERLERGLQDLLRLSQDPLGCEVKRGMGTQDRQDFQRPGLKDAILPLQVLAGQPEQRRPSQAQQGWQERLDRFLTQLVLQDPAKPERQALLGKHPRARRANEDQRGQ